MGRKVQSQCQTILIQFLFKTVFLNIYYKKDCPLFFLFKFNIKEKGKEEKESRVLCLVHGQTQRKLEYVITWTQE